MNILILDIDKVGLPFAMRCQDARHTVKVWQSPEKGGGRSKIGAGIIDRVPIWRPHMKWADLIVMTDNSKYGNELEPFFKQGYPIFGCNQQAAQLELDREAGQKALEKAGIETLPYEVFTNYDKAIEFVKKENKPFVSKPWGGNPDKSLSYVPKSPEDLICMLEYWKRLKLKGEFLLQEKIEGTEMAVGGWFGPGGWSQWINENWEEKKVLNDGLGPNCGEMGTVLRYVKESTLFDEVLKPCTDILDSYNYVGYVDMNCIIDTEGQAWPLEWTCRMGWPHFNIAMSLHKYDPAEWMLDLLDGKDTLECSREVAVGVVMKSGFEDEEVEGFPIRGITSSNKDDLYLTSVMKDKAPVEGGKTAETMVMTGTYVLVATGTGSTVTKAQDAAYKVVEEISWPPPQVHRTDIGNRMEEGIEALQEHGYANGLRF